MQRLKDYFKNKRYLDSNMDEVLTTNSQEDPSMFGNLFGKQEGVEYIPPSKTRSILAGLSDALLASETGRDPNYLGTLQSHADVDYKRRFEAQKALEERQRQDQLMGLKLQADAREGEKLMRDADQKALENEQSLAFTDSILAQYPELQAKNVTGDDLIKLANLIETQKTRRFYQNQEGKNKQDEITDRQLRTQKEKLSKRIQDSGLKTLSDSLDQIDQLMVGETDIPGYGQTAMSPGLFLSKSGKRMRNLVEGLSNIQLKERSGAAVTAQEFKRFLNEFGKGNFKNDEQLKIGLQRLRESVNRDTDTIQRGYDQSVIDDYYSGEGYSPVAEGFTYREPETQTIDPRLKRIQELEAKKAKK